MIKIFIPRYQIRIKSNVAKQSAEYIFTELDRIMRFMRLIHFFHIELISWDFSVNKNSNCLHSIIMTLKYGTFIGAAGHFLGGSNQYAVYEQVNDRPIQSGIFSWLQTGPQINDNEIQNKIAPGSEFRINEEKAEARTS